MTNWILGDKFYAVYPHKNSIKGLWDSKWKFACQKSVYPFHDGAFEDFEPIFEKLISENINDACTDEYTSAFLSTAKSLEIKAEEEIKKGNTEKASEYNRRAAVVYRISRFPYVGPASAGTNQLKRAAFDRQKQVYLDAVSTWSPAIKEVVIPHKHRAGLDGASIPLLVRVPEHASPSKPVPVVLIMTGLDGYRCDNSQRTHEIVGRGWATIICEIPGTADCPADPADPQSPDRLWNSVLEYMVSRREFDMQKVAAWGLSAGGYYAIRAGSTHGKHLLGCVAHGPGSHHFLSPEWLERIDDHEYPFLISPAMAEKYGFKSVEEFKKNGQKKFSLIETGIADKPSCRILLLNGVDDGVVPIEDCLVLFNHGSPKEGRFIEKLPHMGYPNTLPVAYEWFEKLLAKNAEPGLKN
ncbi:conidial pigment biosynthesis protein Ayg1 [Talaromyces proteolyticus]|uniref:Conidial pigment biosynthesis protein Ayg1 n=1 Tax=Talaromyces proteolyticus TaxID=1131652 RepID=A0AAD4KVQ6_9EURO|nr:conidial pigment biosynthesis protein Ayg1 [Talaromyces proteolyticus]KAH8702102.1 conidial pigment biosynthesis protein Ayg1 [Talaromyces proteolyticus]